MSSSASKEKRESLPPERKKEGERERGVGLRAGLPQYASRHIDNFELKLLKKRPT